VGRRLAKVDVGTRLTLVRPAEVTVIVSNRLSWTQRFDKFVLEVKPFCLVHR